MQLWAVHRIHSPREGISVVLEQCCSFPKGCGNNGQHHGPPGKQATGTGLKWPAWELR